MKLSAQFIFCALISLHCCFAQKSDNKTIGEFCENRIAKPEPIGIEDLEEEVRKRNESGQLKEEYEKIPSGSLFFTTEGEKAENIPRNRYGEKYLPYDHSRVKLNKIGDGSLTDYINANRLNGVNLPNRYIATQGPLKNTAADFWRMVWENEAAIIVMLTRLMDDGKEKCYKYWPDDLARYGLIEVSLEKADYVTNYIVRTFLIKYRGEVRRVVHYHFIVWPDEGVPEPPELILNFAKLVRSNPNYVPHKPVVVHCSGGMGRTGTFILIDSMLQAAETNKEVDFAQQLCLMRQRRINVVETLPQYILAHEAVAKAVTAEKAS
ncbi:protein tyrosine phosphatase-like protein [Dinothrombium tinctorium]|uniref:protein-tyrosine-phosphatase n=1 Tax=Dinothrombium tinctorium TaxID=1965070 RepID=A0A3S3SGZ6_9ACAR|nr:protein tyrosine phosphatase-like protein [Dinothrombium tinctorium]